jgi:hypothetical protein
MNEIPVLLFQMFVLFLASCFVGGLLGKALRVYMGG